MTLKFASVMCTILSYHGTCKIRTLTFTIDLNHQKIRMCSFRKSPGHSPPAHIAGGGGGRGSKRPTKFKQMYNYMKHHWNFNGGVWEVGVSEKIPLMGEIWIFSEKAQFQFETRIFLLQ